MNKEEIEWLQTRLHEINSFFPYEKNSYHYLYNQFFHTTYPYDVGFKPSLHHKNMYKEMVQYQRFYTLKDPV
jgi:hypothetical protein